MKTFLVSYRGNATKFKGFKTSVNANSEREAVIDVYKSRLDDNYYPEVDDNEEPTGRILDCDGNVICEADDNSIDYDGGSFTAELLNDYVYDQLVKTIDFTDTTAEIMAFLKKIDMPFLPSEAQIDAILEEDSHFPTIALKISNLYV